MNICIYDGFVLTDLIDCYNVLTTLSFANPESYFGFLKGDSAKPQIENLITRFFVFFRFHAHFTWIKYKN